MTWYIIHGRILHHLTGCHKIKGLNSYIFFPPCCSTCRLAPNYCPRARGCGFRLVRYLEAKFILSCPFGSNRLSVIRSRRLSAPRRFVILVRLSIRATAFVRYMEAVRSWEGPFWEVPLYTIPVNMVHKTVRIAAFDCKHRWLWHLTLLLLLDSPLIKLSDSLIVSTIWNLLLSGEFCVMLYLRIASSHAAINSWHRQ